QVVRGSESAPVWEVNEFGVRRDVARSSRAAVGASPAPIDVVSSPVMGDGRYRDTRRESWANPGLTEGKAWDQRRTRVRGTRAWSAANPVQAGANALEPEPSNAAARLAAKEIGTKTEDILEDILNDEEDRIPRQAHVSCSQRNADCCDRGPVARRACLCDDDSRTTWRHAGAAYASESAGGVMTRTCRGAYLTRRPKTLTTYTLTTYRALYGPLVELGVELEPVLLSEYPT